MSSDPGAPPIPPATTAPGDTFVGRYRIEAPLGQGAMGWVFAARQLSLDRLVALKMLPPDVATDPQRLARFRREAQALSQVQHKHVVQLIDYDVDERSGQPFIVSELVVGRTLVDALRADGPMTEARALAVAVEIAQALAATHAANIVHRDLKPANIMLTKKDEGGPELIKVLDFGLVTPPTASHGRLTAVGSFLGTPEFASPEQFMAEPVEAASDLYSLGCVLFACLTGRAPYLAEGFMEIARLHLDAPVPELPERAADGGPISEATRALCRSLMAKKASARPPSAAAVAAELEAILASRDLPETRPMRPAIEPETLPLLTSPVPEGPRRRGPLILVGGAALLGALLWSFAARAPRPPAEPERSPAVAPAAVPVVRSSTRAPMAIPRPAEPTSPAPLPSTPEPRRRPALPIKATAAPDAGYPVW